MKRELCLTEDGSHTLFIPELNEHYHSVHGAVNESLHVYIEAGLKHLLKQKSALCVFEVGWGTALNMLLTESFAPFPIELYYTAIEAFPLTFEEYSQLNYVIIFPRINHNIYWQAHALPWNTNEYTALREHFYLKKVNAFLQNYNFPEQLYDLVYFDAFAPDIQPELWTKNVFERIFHAMKKEGILCTYSAKGVIRRRLQEVGFTVERLPGACGKREMLRATKS